VAGTYQAGTALLDVLPSLKGFHSKIRRELAGINPTVNVELTANTRELQRRLSGVGDVTVGVDLDTGSALSQLAALKAVGSRAASINGSVDLDTGAALSKLAVLSAAGAAAMGAFAGVGAVAGAAFAAIPAAVAAAGAAVGTLAVGLNGVVDGFKAFSDADKQAATNATSNAKQQTSAARQIASAQQQVAAARTGLARAYQDAGWSAAAADRRVQDAERQLVTAQKTALQAQQDLTRARDDAKRAMRDLNFEVQGGALAERQAVLDLADAQAELDKARASGLSGDSLERVQIAYEQQALSLDEVRSRNKDLASEKAAADRAGVDGSTQVVAAQQRAQDATAGVADAQRGVADAGREAAQQQVQSQRSIADAQLQVTQAQIQLGQAMADSGTVGAASIDKINAAMKELSPNAQAFVLAFQGLKPALQAVGDSVQDTLFAGLDTQMSAFAGTVLPDVASNLNIVAGALNGVVSDMMGFLATQQVAEQMRALFEGLAPVISAAGPLIQNVLSLFLQMASAGMPALTALLQALSSVASQIMAALAPLMASGEFQAALMSVAQVVLSLAPILAQVIALVVQLAAAVGPQLAAMIGMLAPVIQQLAPIIMQLAQQAFALLVPLMQAVLDVIASLLPPISQLLTALSPLIPVVVQIINAITPLITQLVSRLAPILVQVAQIIAQVLAQALVQLLPLLPMLFNLFTQIFSAVAPILPMLAQMAAQILAAVVPAIMQLAPVIITLIQALLPLLSPLMDLVGTLLPLLVSMFTALMPIITFLAQLLGGVLGVVLQTVIVPVLNLLVGALNVVADAFKFVWAVLEPIFTAIGEAGQWLWEHMLKPAFDAITGAVGAVGDAFTAMGDTIGGLWQGIKDVVHAGVQGIVDLVYNNGIRAIINAVIEYIPGVDYLPEWKVPSFATGGILPGYAPGKDTQLIAASPGEGILVPELVRAVGPEVIMAANAAAMRGRPGFARGGIVGGFQRFADGGVVAPTPATGGGDAVTLDPAAMLGLGVAADTVETQIAALALQVSTVLVPALVALAAQSTATTVALVTDINTLWLRQQLAQQQLGGSWAAVTLAVQTSVTAQNVALAGLDAALAATRTAMALTAAAAVSEFGRMQAAAANPIRWVLTYPFNAGIIAAWNQLNTDFALGKPVAPVPIGFAGGGHVQGPGTGTSDSIWAWLSNDEFVVKSKISRQVLPFLEALNAGQPEALQAAGYKTGGLVTDTGSQYNAAIARGLAFAKAQNGKPYIWGGVGPEAFDCSGYMSAITNVLRGEANPYRRVGVARSEPWPGFTPGLTSAFALGASATHTAGTLGGVNVESTGSHVRFGGDAHGADDRQFSVRSSLPLVGGQFAPGGGGLDLAALVGPYFADTHRMIGQITALYANLMGTYAQGITQQGADGTQRAAVSALTALESTSSAAGSPEVRAAVKAVAATFGWGTGPQWDALDWIIGHESGWNPSAANPTSSARGLFQKMTSVNGPIEPTVTGQAQWGLNYIRGRYHDPIGAKTWWQGHHWYDQGGIATGVGLLPKATPEPERVLSPGQTRSFDALVAHIGSGRTLTASPSGADSGGGQFTGQLFLDSGELLGVVDGRITQHDNDAGAALLRGAR